MTKSSRLTAIITIGAVLVLGVDYKMAASQTRAPHYANRIAWTGVYTHEQAARGKLAYTQLCSRCHREDLSGGETGPRLKGPVFVDRWHDLELLDVFAKIQSGMPHDYEGFVAAASARDIVSFLLSENDVPAGDKELSADIEELGDILITRPPSQAK